MVGGFNHNFSYKGAVYHVQSEDGGVRNPVIVTLLYRGGTILASRKINYADIIRVDNLAQVVEELMKEQHKDMLRSLKNGEFDEVIARYLGAATSAGRSAGEQQG
jgi:ketol-acid reductoisomerase